MAGPITELIEAIKQASPLSSHRDVVRIIVKHYQVLRLMRLGSISALESQMLHATVCCHVCFRIREQLPDGSSMVCCPECKWGWCCKEHWAEHTEEHKVTMDCMVKTKASQARFRWDV